MMTVDVRARQGRQDHTGGAGRPLINRDAQSGSLALVRTGSHSELF